MKKTFLFLALATLFFSAPAASGQANEEFKPGGKIFGLLFTDFHTTFSGGENTSAFEVARSYLGLDYSFSRTFSSRILYDGTTAIMNNKTIYSAYLKNAYLQFDNGIITIRGGLTGSEQVSAVEKLWDHRYISKVAIDLSEMLSSADLGVAAKVRAGEKAAFDVAVTNGRGYKNLAPDGTYRFSAGASVMPLKELIIRGYYDIMGSSGSMQRTASITAGWNGQGLRAGAEYLRQDNNKMIAGNNFSGFSIFTSMKFSEKVSLFARYDDFNSVVAEGSSEPWNLAKDGSTILIGLDISPAHNIRFSPNFGGFIPDDASASFAATVGLNVEARF
jgi:hypothetical protein